MSPRQRIVTEWWLVCLLACALGISAALGSWLWRADLALHDWQQSRTPRQADPDVVIVAIDEASLTSIGRWPWPRQLHATLIDQLSDAGAAGVALDLMFAEPGEGDIALARAIARNGKVVLPVFQQERDGQISGEQMPVGALVSKAAALGHIQMELDPDGIARSVYLREGWELARHVQFAAALWQLAGGPAIPVGTRVSREQWQRADWLRIPFVGPPGSFTQYSYVDVLTGAVPRERLRGKLVLVGATALGLSDTVPVPTSALHRPMPGVEVHANVLTALRAGTGLRIASPVAQALLAAIACLALMSVLARCNARAGLLWTLGTLALLVLICGVLMRSGMLWMGPMPALLACAVAWPLWSWRRLEATQRYLDEELSALRDESPVPAVRGLDPMQQRLQLVRRAAHTSRALRKLIEDTVAHLPVGVVVLRPDGQLVLANAKARALLAASGDGAVLEALRATRWPPPLETRAGLPQTPAAPMQIAVQSAAGVPMLASFSALDDVVDASSSLVIGLADLSAERAAQQSRDDTLRFVSHDLRAPLASVLSLIDAPPADEPLLPRLRRHTASALELADELFRLARIEAADPARFEPVDLRALCDEACDELWAQARTANCRFDMPPYGEEWLVVGSSELLRRALINLIGNAIKYGEPGQTVEIGLQREEAFIAVRIRDHGPGIPVAERGGLFQRFKRLPGALARGIAGHGLGLVMVRTVAERHGGSVAFEAPGDGGSCFVLRLPAA
ncbi:CHASE2 domain-containing protein [Viridibacterium curvum]|uniref:histidine kinase n=1 Tax=Viridibacterium curvum TaxID=1101404 RepID=A0ABP9QPX3_9RHOO